MEENNMTYETYDVQTEAIISAGLQLLREHLGIIETEIFLTKVTRKGFDYTQWRESLYADMNLDELLAHAAKTTQDYQPPKGVKTI
jgi:hypothetical protein